MIDLNKYNGENLKYYSSTPQSLLPEPTLLDS